MTPVPSAASTTSSSESADASSIRFSKPKRALEDDAENDEGSNKRQKHESDDDAVRELLSHLVCPETSDDDAAKTTGSWKDVLEKHFATPSFARLAKFVSAQR